MTGPLPVLLGVSDEVARSIAERLLADVARKERIMMHGAADTLLGSMRNPKSQQRSHRRLVAAMQPLVIEDRLTTGRQFQSWIANLTEANGWVLSAAHRGVGIRIDIIGCEGRGQRLTSGNVMVGVIDQHLLPRLVQRAGLTSYEGLLQLIKAWSHMLLTESTEVLKIAEWLHAERLRVLVPMTIGGKVSAVLTGSEPGLEVDHPILRAITLLSHDMLTADDCRQIELLGDEEMTRTQLIKRLPRRQMPRSAPSSPPAAASI